MMLWSVFRRCLPVPRIGLHRFRSGPERGTAPDLSLLKNARIGDRLTHFMLPEVRPRQDVVLLLEPFHPLGTSICRRLALDGLRPIAVSGDPTAGEAFCSRLALEGFTVPHRAIDLQLDGCELRLARDVQLVYGGLRGMISFFRPRSGQGHWLDVPLVAADDLLRRSTSGRLRMLRALAPLLANRGFLQDVIMGRMDGAGARLAQVDGAAAHLWDDLLADEWERRGIRVRRTYTRLQMRGGQAELADDVERVLADFQRCLSSSP